MRGVLGRGRPERDDVVVARTLALGAQSALRDPGKRVEPVRRANYPSGELCERVTARDVGDIVA
jgi:hypothetical protein